MRIIIGFCGAAGAGKDTAAALLSERCAAQGVTATMVSFADPMRAMLLALGVPAEYMTDRELKELPVPGFGLSYRRLAQTLGTEWGRQCNGKNFWVNALARRIENAVGVILLTDVRFPNEAGWLLGAGGTLVRVVNPRAEPVAEHASETYVASLPANYEILNDGSIDALREKAYEAQRFAARRAAAHDPLLA